MNLGQQMVFPTLQGSAVNALDEATRERLLAEHIAANLQNQSLSTALVNAGLVPTNAFINLSAPGPVVNHTINLLRAPVATLAQNIGLNNTSAVIGHNIGLKAALAHIPGLGFNHALSLNLQGAPNSHQFIARLPPGAGMNMGPKGPGMSMNPSLGQKQPGTGVGNSTNDKSPGSNIAYNIGTRIAVPVGNHSMNPRAAGMGMNHSNAPKNGGWRPTPSVGMQMGNAQAIAMQLAANPNHQRLVIPGVSGYPQKQKAVGVTYLDDFKQGFPSKGLSVAQNRWWGSAEPSKQSNPTKSTENEVSDGPNGSGRLSTTDEADISKPSSSSATQENGREDKSKEVLVSCATLSRLRKRAADKGKSSLQLAVTRGYGVQKIGRQQSRTLHFIFGKSMPTEWSAALSSSD